MSEIIKLTYGNTTARIRQKGAEMVSFTGNNGREVIWQADPAVWSDSAPILFPVCGTPKNHQVIINGVVYPMAQHGFCKDSKFDILKVGDDFVDLVLTPNDAIRRQYPFEFIFHVIYKLHENGFRTEFVIENKSDRVMPFCVGGHPGIIVPMEPGASYNDYQFVFPYPEEGKNLLVTADGLMDGYEYIPLENGTTLELRHDYFDQRDTLVFSEFKSRSVKLVHKVTGKGIQCSYPQMEVLAIWSMPENYGNYVCIEPWHGLPGFVAESGRFEDKPFVTLLAPGMTYQCGYDIDLI